MKEATGIILWFLRYSGALAVTMPWKKIYCRPGQENNDALFVHECIHIQQIERDGAVKWTLKVFYYLLRYGYASDKNPYEQEARNLSGI